MPEDRRESRAPRADFMMLGEVTDNADPLKLGRVRAKVRGHLEPESVWALPIGAMLGVKNGFHAVPEVGANVVVFLNQGDPQHPYYAPGPFGAPDGASDVPEQAPGGSVDHLVIRWRDFHITLAGVEGQEKATFEDLTSGTKLEVTRATGNFTREVDGPQGDEIATIKRHLVEAVGGNETHGVTGNRTTAIGGNDTKTVGGNEQTTIAGARTEVVGTAETKTVGLSSSEVVGLSKSIAAGLNVSIAAAGLVNIVAGGVASLIGAGTVMQSTAGGQTIAAGLQENTFLGGINEQVVGNVDKTVSGDKSASATGTYAISAGTMLKLLSAAVKIGVEVAAKKLVTRDLFTLWANVHTHAGLGAPPTQKILPGATAPDIDETLVQTANVEAS